MTNEIETVDGYYASEPLVLPLRHSVAGELTTLNVECGKCGKMTTDLHGTAVDHATCIEIHAAGVCCDCNAVTWARLRYYGEYCLHCGKDGWNRYKFRYSFFGYIQSKAKSLLWK